MQSSTNSRFTVYQVMDTCQQMILIGHGLSMKKTRVYERCARKKEMGIAM